MAEFRIYLDHAATTPMLAAAREAMVEALSRWHNPSSPHTEGRAAKAMLEDARVRVAAALDWTGKIIFTSGATEALAIALQRAKAGPRYVSAVEHEAVFRVAPEAVKLGVSPDGIADLSPVKGECPLVAVQYVNNETGVIQPLGEIAEQIRAQGGLLIADCSQAAGKLPLPDADMIVISAHKFGGPPGIGALLLRDFGLVEAVGGQEMGYRPGTHNLPAIIGMAVALEADPEWMDRATAFRQKLEAAIVGAGGEVVAANAPRMPTIGAYRMPGMSSQAQLIRFDMAGIAVSGGSACTSGSVGASHVLAAMGWSENAAREVIRVSFGRSTTIEDVDRFVHLWCEMASTCQAA